MTGIVLCIIALVVAIAALALRLFPTLQVGPAERFGWGVWLCAAVILMAIALLWGNVGVIYSHAGFTG
jgi:hypothetical protein